MSPRWNAWWVRCTCYLYDHANNITIGEIHTNYATNQKIAQWDLGRNLYHNNPRYLIRHSLHSGRT